MQGVTVSGLDQLGKTIDELLEQAPKRRRQLHEKIGEAVLGQVREEISVSIHDSHGTVAGWQQSFVGSKGGYVAVRPAGGISGDHSPGAITNYLNNGHKIRRPKTLTGKYYRSRVKLPYVDGRHFYQSAAVQSEAAAIREAEAFADELVQMLGG